MTKKIIVMSLLLINLKMMCGETLVIQPAMPCEISYCNKKIEDIRKYKPENCTGEYGFSNNTISLIYSEKHRRGIIHTDNHILQHLSIPKQQFLDISSEVKNGFSIAKLQFNTNYSLTSHPLYVTCKQDGKYTFYKIHWFENNKLTPIQEALYSSNSNQENLISDRKWLLGIGIGIPVGIVILGLGSLYVLLRIVKDFHIR